MLAVSPTPTAAPTPSCSDRRALTDVDALLLLSFGGPEAPEQVMPFLRNVTRGRDIPDARLADVAEHYLHFGGASPINGINRALIGEIRALAAARGEDLPVYFGNRNWAPFLADTVARMRDEIRQTVLDWGEAGEFLNELELAEARSADQRALGRLLLQLLNMGSQMRDSRSPGPSVPLYLQAIIARATAPRHEAQFSSLQAMAEALTQDPAAREREVNTVLRFCPSCGGQSIDTKGYGSPWTGLCNHCGSAFTMLMTPGIPPRSS